MPLHAKRKIGHPGISFLFFLVTSTRVSRPKNQKSPARFRRKLDLIGAILGRAVVVGSDRSSFASTRTPESLPGGAGVRLRFAAAAHHRSKALNHARNRAKWCGRGRGGHQLNSAPLCRSYRSFAL